MNTVKRKVAKKKEMFLLAYKTNACNVSAACEAVNIGRTEYYNWRKNDKEFDKACEEVYESLMDFSESMLLKNIKAGREASLFFFLVNRSKGRWQHIQKIVSQIDTSNNPQIESVLNALSEALKGARIGGVVTETTRIPTEGKKTSENAK